MAELSLTDAQGLAASLVTIGHPYSQAAINATALDLIAWCKGEVIDGLVVLPKEQAQEIINEARLNWEGGWPENGGTKRLLEVFRAKFDPSKLGPERQVLDSKKWEQQYGPPEPAFAGTLLKVATKAEHSDARKAMRWQSIRDPIYYTEGPGRSELANIVGREDRVRAQVFWREAMDSIRKHRPAEIAPFRLELEQHGWSELMAFDWTKGAA